MVFESCQFRICGIRNSCLFRMLEYIFMYLWLHSCGFSLDLNNVKFNPISPARALFINVILYFMTKPRGNKVKGPLHRAPLIPTAQQLPFISTQSLAVVVLVNSLTQIWLMGFFSQTQKTCKFFLIIFNLVSPSTKKHQMVIPQYCSALLPPRSP